MQGVATNLEVVIEHTCLLGEGPVWDHKHKAIYWIDILNGIIHEYLTEKALHRAIAVHQMIGSIAIGNDQNLIAALQNGFAFINRASGDIKWISNPESHLTGNRFNEGKCDPQGRFLAGTMSLLEQEPTGSVYMLDKDLTVTKKIENVTISNGLAWTADDKTLYYIDTPTFTVVAYDYDKNTGELSNKRTAITISKEDGYPDGMTIDNEGMLWIAHWDGWQVTRWNPISGKKLLSIGLPVSRITSCTFGGSGLDDLYITSARIGLTEEELKAQPLAGSLFVLRNSGFTGMPTSEFKTPQFAY